MNGTASTSRARRGRWSRWALRVVAAAAVVAAVLMVAATVLLGHLDEPWVKRRVQSLVRSVAGAEIDYTSARVRPLSGMRVENLVLLSPPALRSIAPHLLRVGRLEMAWSPSALLADGARIERLSLDDVALTMVEDERGRSSLDALSPKAEGAHAKPTRAPRPPAWPGSAAPPIGRFAVSGAELTWIRADSGQILDRLALRGLALRGEIHRAASDWRLEARVGEPSAPLPLLLVRDGAGNPGGHARLELWIEGQIGPSGASAKLDLCVGDQTILPRVSVREVLHLDATASFDTARAMTEVSVAQARAAEGAATAKAQVAFPGAPDASPVVREASGVVDLERLLRVLPPGLVPLEGRGTLRWMAKGVEVGRLPRLLADGSLTADAELASVRLKLATGVATVGSGRFSVRAQAGTEGPDAQLSLRARSLGFANQGGRLSADAMELQSHASREREGAWTGSAALGLAALRLTNGNALGLRGVRVEASARNLRLDPAAPLSASGEVEFTGAVAKLDGRTPNNAVTANGLRFRLHVPLGGGAPFTVQADLAAPDLRVFRKDARVLARGPARVEMKLTDLVPDLDRPAASRVTAHAVARLGALEASLDVTKHADALDVAFAANGRDLPLGRYLPGEADAGPKQPDGIGLALSGSGHVEALSSSNPAIRQQTELRIDGPGLARISAKRVVVTARSTGDLRRHRAEVGVQLDLLKAAAPWHVSLTANAERAPPALAFKLAAEGGPSGSLSGSARLDGSNRVLLCDLQGQLAGLGSLRRLLSRLPGLSSVRLAPNELAVEAHARVADVVSYRAGEGSLSLSPHPMLDASVDGAVDIRAKGIRWQDEDRLIAAPSAVGHLEIRTEGPRHVVRGSVQAEELQLALGEHKVEGFGLATRFSGSVDRRLVAGEADLALDLSLRSVQHDFAPYPVGGLTLELSARRNEEGVLRISKLYLENSAAGTILSLQGGLDRSFVRRRLSLHGQLRQDLARAWTAPETFEGRGRVDVTFQVESSGLSVFRTQAALRLDGVHARFPRAGVSVESLDGEIPFSADVVVDGRSITLLRRPESNPFSMHRFADQHPLFRRNSFLSVARIASPIAEITSLAGNLKMEQNLVSLSQFEMGLRGGRVTGDCVLDWNDRNSVLRGNVRATGVLSSHGEPFDGSAAFVVQAGERSIDGRIDVLRIGARHLLDILDLQDPLRVDAATNRIRNALRFGYPDRIRVELKHGFASMRVTFGGLAKFLSVGDVRGIPTGPIVDRMLAPFLELEDE
jgi:translocation and assembly module TamB